MKKMYLVICIIALVTCVTGIPLLVQGIAERGPAAVNYGRVVVPLLLSGFAFWLYKRKEK